MRETYYSHNDLYFYKYNADYKQTASKVIIRKYTFDSSEIISQHNIPTQFTIHQPSNLIIFDSLSIEVVNRIFNNERVFTNMYDMLPQIVRAVKAERLNPKYEIIQGIIEEYPELFV